MSRNIPWIVSLGARTPVGLRAPSSSAAINAGISRVKNIEASEDNPVIEGFVAPDARLPWATAGAAERMQALGGAALAEVLAHLEPRARSIGSELKFFVGFPEPRPGWARTDVAHLGASWAADRAPFRLSIEPILSGHAAALEAIQSARRHIVEGKAQIALAGGVDSYVDGRALSWLDQNRRRTSELVRSGFIPGEAAAVVVLMHPALAEKAGLSCLAAVSSASSAQETKLLSSNDVVLGEGLTRAVHAAWAEAGTPKAAIEDIYCDINGERYRSEEWGFVALRSPEIFRDPSDYYTAVPNIGDVGAATGVLNAVRCAWTWQRKSSRRGRALIWGSSEGGLRSAVILSAPRAER